ncbi:hypothetical protein F3B35_10145 [Bacteroides intestinalis]|nr:hypothetical protein F3B35_10145 [Bacteroides intestinalis]
MAGIYIPLEVKPPHRHFYLFSLRWLRKIVVGAYSFHHGESCFPPWSFFLSTTVERINVRMEKANRWKGKSIGMPKNGVSYCI